MILSHKIIDKKRKQIINRTNYMKIKHQNIKRRDRKSRPIENVSFDTYIYFFQCQFNLFFILCLYYDREENKFIDQSLVSRTNKKRKKVANVKKR